MLSRSFIFCLLFLAVSLPVQAKQDCRTMGATVQENEYQHLTYITREDPNAVKKCLEKELGGNRWEKKDGVDTLIVFCPSRKGSPDMKAAEVELAVQKRQESLKFLSSIQPKAANSNVDSYSFLAQQTGRSKQEADVLREKYAKLGYFRYIKTADGRQMSEGEIIGERHKKRLGISDSDSGSNSADDKKKQRAELKEKIKEAKKRGDMAEMMRLASEGQQFAGKESDKVYEQSWQLMESQYPEMLQASYPVRFTYMPELCIP
jgi:hypothetical protein